MKTVHFPAPDVLAAVQRCEPAPLRCVRRPTPAEYRVLALLLAGYSNKEIGAQLNRAESTVKNQVASLLRKYRVPTRARLIAQWAESSAARGDNAATSPAAPPAPEMAPVRFPASAS